MNSKGAPLNGGGMEVTIVNMEVPRADRLWPQTVEQRHFGTTSHTDCKVKRILKY